LAFFFWPNFLALIWPALNWPALIWPVFKNLANKGRPNKDRQGNELFFISLRGPLYRESTVQETSDRTGIPGDHCNI